MGGSPLFSASAMGTDSSASANAFIAYCSTPTTVLAASSTASAQLISAEPPPYTIALSRTRLRATHSASCSERLISSSTILLPPRTKMVTALRLGQPSTTSILSLVVPKDTSFTLPAKPSLSWLSSWKRGTMRAPVAMASSSISTPPTHRTAGRLLCMSSELASSSKPHWHTTSPAPLSLHSLTMSVKYCCSCLLSSSYFSTVSISTLCLVLGLGGSNGQVRMAILTSLSSLGICGCEKSLSMTMPSTRRVSSMVPPTLPSTLIRSRLTSRRSRSATDSTARTQISAIWSFNRPTTFDESVVLHVFTRGSMFSLLKSNLALILSRFSVATLHAHS
mmetsp:Transcript_27334/g.69558  ORF Transcript_27334/g.69558 Transcript_27334/m.69558 type:complete len:335 (+) Transcript_27334:600-1604(+)